MSSTRLHSKPQGVTVDRTACFLLSHSWHSSNRSNNNGCCCHSVAQSCLTLFDRMDCSTPGFPVLHYLPELAQAHVHWVSDTIQPSHLLPSLSPLAFSLSQHQGLFQWVDRSHQVAKVLELHLQHQSFQWIFRVDFLQDWLVYIMIMVADIHSVLIV